MKADPDLARSTIRQALRNLAQGSLEDWAEDRAVMPLCSHVKDVVISHHNSSPCSAFLTGWPTRQSVHSQVKSDGQVNHRFRFDGREPQSERLWTPVTRLSEAWLSCANSCAREA